MKNNKSPFRTVIEPFIIKSVEPIKMTTESERKVQDALDKLVKDRTVIVIAHRLSTITQADRIIVLDKGHIVESGNHNSLIEENGIYKKLYDSQFQKSN